MTFRGGLLDGDDLATLMCFLHSPAGAYLSGCRLDLDALGPGTTPG